MRSGSERCASWRTLKPARSRWSRYSRKFSRITAPVSDRDVRSRDVIPRLRAVLPTAALLRPAPAPAFLLRDALEARHRHRTAFLVDRDHREVAAVRVPHG